MTYEAAIKEMREHEEWQRRRNIQDAANRSAITRLHALFTDEEIRKWAVIDAMVRSISSDSEPPADIDVVRDGILQKKGEEE